MNEGMTIMSKGLAKQVFIELTTACNFSCDYCPYHLVTRKKSVMSLESLRRILDEIQRLGEPIEYVMFSAMGEPLLYPHLKEACHMVKQAGYELKVTTNGALLEDSHRTIEMDYLYISFRSTGLNSFAHRNTNLSFDDYLKRLAKFLSGNIQKTIVYFSFNDNVLWPQNYEKNWMNILDVTQEDELLRSLNGYGRRLFPEFKPLTALPRMDTYIEVRKDVHIYFSRMYSWANIMLPPGYAVILAERIDYCDYNEKHIVVYANGDVTACCMDYNGELAIGNIYKEPLDMIMNRKSENEKLIQYRICRMCKGRAIKTSQGFALH
jgi:MoaA/NifB/PqqE/SkfB family radical SAM enzyme